MGTGTSPKPPVTRNAVASRSRIPNRHGHFSLKSHFLQLSHVFFHHGQPVVTFVAVDYLQPIFALGDEGGDGSGGLGSKLARKQRALWTQGAGVVRHVYVAGSGVQVDLLYKLSSCGPTRT